MATIRIAATLLLATTFMVGCNRDAPTGATEHSGARFSADASPDASVTLNPGEIIEFVVPDHSPIINALEFTNTPPFDLIVIDGSSGTLRGSNCATDPSSALPVQEAAMVTTGPGTPPMKQPIILPSRVMMQTIMPVVVISQGQRVPLTGPVRAGTRLRHFSSPSACAEYDVYPPIVFQKVLAEVQ